MRSVVLLVAGLALAACAAPMGGQTANPIITTALDTQPDGYIGSTRPGEVFQIVSTAASQSRLCRVVTIEGPDSYDVESFCKAPGGRWR